MEILSSLSDSEIISQLSQLVKTEKEITERIVRHFAEVERRRLYLELGYGNLFDYATRGLGYSNAAAMRRITAARAGLQASEVFDCLETGELNLSTIEKFAPLMKKHGASSLVQQFKGKSVQEAEVIAARLNPVAENEIRDRIKVVAVKAPEINPNQASLGANGGFSDETSCFRSEVKHKEETTEKMYHVSFAANEEFMRQLERAKVLSFQGRKDDVALQNVLGQALEEFLKRMCPKEREARRRARRERKAAAEAALQKVALDVAEPVAETVAGSIVKVLPKETSAVPSPGQHESMEERSSQIPAAMRDEVLVRDGFCCTFVSADGVRCESRRNLEVDHRVPFAVGGETSLENLRTLCAPHNLFAAYERFPRGFMDACVVRPDREMPEVGQG